MDCFATFSSVLGLGGPQALVVGVDICSDEGINCFIHLSTGVEAISSLGLESFQKPWTTFFH